MSFWAIDNLKSVTAGRWLERPPQPIQLHGVGTDSRDNLSGKIFVALQGDRFDGHEFLSEAVGAGAAMLIVERDVTPHHPQGVGVLQVDSSKKALARLALAYRRTLRGTRVIAVAGSAGKTTTKTLIDAALKTCMTGSVSPKSFNNDIGVPLTILNTRPADKYLIVEVGTNNLGEVANLAAMIEPDVAVITMIGREHIQGLISLEHIAHENAALLSFLRPGGMAVLNADAPLLRKCAKNLPQIVWFGEAADADLRLSNRGHDNTGWWFEVNGRLRFNLSLPGKHNAVNALAAVAVARRLGVSDEHINLGLSRAEGPPMRSAIQHVGTGAEAVMIYNDAYNANPESMAASLETFAEITPEARRRIVILGDMLELGAAAPDLHRDVGRHLLRIDQRTGIDRAVFVGELSARAADEVARHWERERITTVRTLDSTAINAVAALIQPGDAVLLKGSRGMGLERIIPAIEQRIQSITVAKNAAPPSIQNQKSKIKNLVSAPSAPVR